MWLPVPFKCLLGMSFESELKLGEVELGTGERGMCTLNETAKIF